MLNLNGRAKVIEAAEKYEYSFWETLKCLD